MNKAIQSMYCIRCEAEFAVGDYPYGCPCCLKTGHPASLSFRYNGRWEIHEKQEGMKRYAAMLPYEDFPTLGEGGTPVTRFPALAEEQGLGTVYTKNEFQNPTGSHKDRMNPLIVARAKEVGSRMIIAASSGNEGISLACYAAKAKLPCCIVVTQTIASGWKKAIEASGAAIITTETAMERWEVLREKTEKGWFCATNLLDPPVGSCSYGLQGYKTIAYEVYEQLPGELPDYLMIPVTRGDLLWGVCEGFLDLKNAGKIAEVPHLIAVEPFERIERTKTLEDAAGHFEGRGDKTPSIAGTTVTIQSLLALEKTGGFAVSVSQEEAKRSVGEMGKHGLYLEASSALLLPALKKLLRAGRIPKRASVMLVATSHGFKNP